jgi:hypothetical protein
LVRRSADATPSGLHFKIASYDANLYFKKFFAVFAPLRDIGCSLTRNITVNEISSGILLLHDATMQNA